MKRLWIVVVLISLSNGADALGMDVWSADCISLQTRATEKGISAARQADDSQVEPPVSEADIRIVQRAKEILNSPEKWNRADTRICAKTAATYSLYCALEAATLEVSASFEHRGAAMQQARFVIDEDLAKGNHYEHRLKDYNNDPKTTFADVQEFFRLLEGRIRNRLTKEAVPRAR